MRAFRSVDDVEEAQYVVDSHYALFCTKDEVLLDLDCSVTNLDGIPQSLFIGEQSPVNPNHPNFMEISANWILKRPDSNLSFESFDSLYKNMIEQDLDQFNFQLKVVDLRAMKYLRRKVKANSEDASDGYLGSCRVFVSYAMPSDSIPHFSLTVALLHQGQVCDESVPLHIESVICRGCQTSHDTLREGFLHASKCPNQRDFDSDIMCYICGLNYQSIPKLETHLVHDHLETGSFFPCLKCRKHFFQEKDWLTHNQNQHSDSKARFPCQCGREFVTKGQLNRHQRQVHEDIRPFPCTRCDLNFKLKEQWTKHQLVHKMVKKHECSLCQKTFRTRSNLKQHLVRCKKSPKNQAKVKNSTTSRDQSVLNPGELSDQDPTPSQVRFLEGNQPIHDNLIVDNIPYVMEYAQNSDLSEAERGRIDEIQSQILSDVVERIPIFIRQSNQSNR